ncbi:hypothetical protein T484DRAFT_3645959 [Baffinella frigidus]|nr:hypothetical protein T484DRAFT_3645959 [Cryptophyta sp. CCMP2293]
MAAKSLESVGPKIEKVINQLIKLRNNITQSAKGVVIHVTDAQDLSISVGDGWLETKTDSKLIPASPQVLFSAGFLPILDDIITQLTTLTELANEYSRRNSEANTDVDTFETTKLRLEFLSLAQQHVMCWKAISDTDTSDSSFSSNGPKMSNFREQFLKESLEDMVAEKKDNGQETTYMGEDVNKKTFQTTLDELTKSTNCLKLSPYYQYAKPEDPLDTHRLGIMTNTITTVEEIVKDMGQVSFTPTEAYTPDKRMKTEFVNHLLSFFYCADNVTEFEKAVQTSALLVTTTAITGKGADGDNKMKEYFYNFIEALFDATKAQALKKELDKKADMFKRKSFAYYTIKVPDAESADQLTWSKEVRQKAAELFSQKAVRVLEDALKDATPQKHPQHIRPKVEKVLREWDMVQPASERETIALHPPNGRGTESPTSHTSTPAWPSRLAPMTKEPTKEPTLVGSSLKAPPPVGVLPPAPHMPTPPPGRKPPRAPPHQG